MAEEKSELRTVFVERLKIPKPKVIEELKRNVSTLGLSSLTSDTNYRMKSGAIKAVVQRESGYEITFAYPGMAELFKKRGLVFEGVTYEVVDALENDLMVTFENVPFYITDEVLVKRLENFGCVVLGPVKRLIIDGVETGDRRFRLSKKAPIPRTLNILAPNGKNVCISIWHRDQVPPSSTN